METTRLKLSLKQNLALQLLNDPQLVDLTYGGGAGGAKSVLVCIWMVLQCRNYPGIRIGLGRKELTRLKQSTLVTLLREVHGWMGVKQHEFVYNDQKSVVTYINGSQIQLMDLARQPSDPNFDRFGSLNFTHTVTEEVAEVDEKARNIFNSRKNRFMNDKYHIVGKSIATCNPSRNYIKLEYYNPYKELGGGDYQKWEHGQVEVDGGMKTAYRAFIRSVAADNPFLPQNYIEVLRQLPTVERKRLLEGDWDFDDSDFMLFKSQVIDRSLIGELGSEKGYIGVDVSDVGKDKTIISYVEANILVDQIAVDIDSTGEKAIGEQISFEIIKYAQQHGMTSLDAQRIAVDTIGVGASTRDFMRNKGWYIKEFIAGSKAISDFRNLRGETLWGLSQAMETGKFKIYNRLPTLKVLREQLMAHEFSTEERTIVIQSKQDIKEKLGVSPDYAESAYIAYWVALGNTDPKNNPNRIKF
jgi:hypothetical protein